jgi:hypothetical protein
MWEIILICGGAFRVQGIGLVGYRTRTGNYRVSSRVYIHIMQYMLANPGSVSLSVPLPITFHSDPKYGVPASYVHLYQKDLT